MKIFQPISLEEQPDKETLWQKFGKNKVIPDSLKLPALITLSYFPELSETKIRFEIRKSELAFASRPAWKTMFRPKEEWEYLIIISNRSTKIPKELLFPNLPINAQIGILGHELSHTVYYQDKNLTDIISIGINYLNSKYRIKFENDTDRETIRRGLGLALLEFAQFTRNHPSIEEDLKVWLDKYYLNPSRIIDQIKNDPAYQKQSW